MTEQNLTKAPQAAASPPAADFFLSTLVALANRFHLGISITLNVKGTIISGILIGGHEYFTKVAETFAGIDGEVGKTFSELATENAGDYVYSEPTGVSEPVPPPHFLHLKDARFYQENGQSFPSDGILWRGRLSEVSGLSIGAFTPSNP